MSLLTRLLRRLRYLLGRDRMDAALELRVPVLRPGPDTSAPIYLRAADGSTETAVAALRDELATMDPDVAPGLVTSISQQIDFFLAPQRVAACFITLFGAVGLVLGALASLAVSRLVSGFVFGVGLTDYSSSTPW